MCLVCPGTFPINADTERMLTMDSNTKMIPNVVFRMKARAVLKPAMPIAILIALIANLPSLAAQTVSILTGSNPLTYLTSQASTDAELMALLSDTNAILAAFNGFISPVRMLSLALYVLSFLLSPVLMLGLTNALLQLLRGQEIGVSTVFSRVGIFFKSILLNLLTALKVVLWSIPGMLIMVAGMVLMIVLNSTWPLMFYLVGLTLMIVQMFRAMLHYAMSTIYLADDPALGVRAALRSSVGMMRHRKMALFSLTLSVYVWLIIGSLLESLVASLFGAVIASTAYMALQLVVSVYMSACHCAFYEGYRQTPYAAD